MAEPITNPAELAHVLSEIACDGAPLHERVWRSLTDGLWARLPITEHTATSTLEVANEDGWEEFWEAWWQPQGWQDAGVALRDAKGVHWLAWTSEDGDTYVRSYPFEGEEEDKDVAAVQGISLASGLEYPVTVWLDARHNPIAPAYQPAEREPTDEGEDIANFSYEREQPGEPTDARVTAAFYRVASVHQIHGGQCLCGFETKGRSRSATEHILDEARAALSKAGGA